MNSHRLGHSPRICSSQHVKRETPRQLKLQNPCSIERIDGDRVGSLGLCRGLVIGARGPSSSACCPRNSSSFHSSVAASVFLSWQASPWNRTGAHLVVPPSMAKKWAPAMHCANGFPSMPHTPMHDVPESEKSGLASSSRLAPGGLQAWLGTFVAPPASARRARQAAKGQRQRSATLCSVLRQRLHTDHPTGLFRANLAFGHVGPMASSRFPTD